MIIYYITPSYRIELYKYGIVNDINFYPSLHEEKSGFVKVEVKVRVIDMMPLSSDLPR